VLHAATIDDVRRALLNEEYDVVHFSGHGTGTGLAFEDVSGSLYVPPQDALAELLADFSPPIRCLLLNACYSVSQGQFTSLGVPYTIAMEGPISDDAAIMFAEGFYDSIGAGKDVDFSFRQGIHTLRLKAHPDSAVPHLLKKGEFATIQQRPNPEGREIQQRSHDASLPPPVLLGLALDVSGSMEQSIGTSLGRQKSRLRGFVDAFENSAARTREALRSMHEGGTSLSVFAYAFGMRTGDVCDLLSLIKAADGLVSAEELESLKAKHTREIERRYSGGSGFGGLESLARSYGFGGLVESVKQGVRADAEAEVRNRVVAELQQRLSARLESIGDTTLDLDQVAEFWRGESSNWDDAEHFIFGDTPMCAALWKTLDRFKCELARQDKRSMPVLLLVSDGEPTDGDPTSVGRQLHEQGIRSQEVY
jgi:CHAT domain